MSLLDVRSLSKSFPHGSTLRPAVDDVSFTLREGETLALVGESGAGKSTTGRLVLRLIDADSGEISIRGRDVRGLRGADLRNFRRDAQMIFQDPFSSLNPRMRIWKAVAEPLLVHRVCPRGELKDRAAALLDSVGLGTHLLDRYPTGLSGGQLQRAAIARALSTDPSLIVCDEPVAALDVSVQAQVINLLLDIQEQRGVAYLFVTHDLALVEKVAHSVAVMRAGKIVEHATTGTLFSAPEQDYTRTLLSAIPEMPETATV
ncbi:ATP-binding cassette domain-containing protein [Rhodococcus rhodochrous]|nr:ATP-binding cassette domain-containing protein [Rhodococcus rhodochrous]MCK8672108.1 ATP-binding cassette domain-containing protein [Rhodococcus sp. HM1]MBF4478611.1 ABC transporter ATP-binding protein [Rhodococcus rhodochrous]MCB8913519.1 ATP-binding cassette domain-containing protein [Rhodococcus rhodochrous]MCD2099870.1 ATP-binding cassette domain-containing protein [Rhodococcus rhodochrous]MCD2124356.1 ATP-binding cassette domain-containing protein [Rhodococcus rhodochrous]